MERVDGMSIGNVNSAWIGAYPYAGKAQRNNAAKAENTGFMRFAEKAAQKAAGAAAADNAVENIAENPVEKYPAVLGEIGKNAPEKVKQAFTEAAKETGGFFTSAGMWISADGKHCQMTKMFVERFVRWLHGETQGCDMLGSTVQSAINAVNRWMYDLDHPLMGAAPVKSGDKWLVEKERRFYESFRDKLEKLVQTDSAEGAVSDRTEAYKGYLKQKYGNVRYESVGKDQKSLDRVGKGMSGNDVIIAPNIVEEMANDSEKAAYYEGKIDDYFHAIPRLKAQFAAQGLNHTPGGIVIHEDGSVTYIGGCDNDTPETRAKIKAEQAAKRGRRERYQELAEETAERRREFAEWQYHKILMAEALQTSGFGMEKYLFIGQPQVSAAAYKRAVGAYGGREAALEGGSQ